MVLAPEELQGGREVFMADLVLKIRDGRFWILKNRRGRPNEFLDIESAEELADYLLDELDSKGDSCIII